MVDAETLQVYFDLAESDLAKTIVSVLEDMWAKAKAEAGIVTDFGTAVDNVNVRNIKERLDYWRRQAGLSDGVAVIGMNSTFTYRADSLQMQAPTYESTEDETA